MAKSDALKNYANHLRLRIKNFFFRSLLAVDKKLLPSNVLKRKLNCICIPPKSYQKFLFTDGLTFQQTITLEATQLSNQDLRQITICSQKGSKKLFWEQEQSLKALEKPYAFKQVANSEINSITFNVPKGLSSGYMMLIIGSNLDFHANIDKIKFT